MVRDGARAVPLEWKLRVHLWFVFVASLENPAPPGRYKKNNSNKKQLDELPPPRRNTNGCGILSCSSQLEVAQVVAAGRLGLENSEH